MELTKPWAFERAVRSQSKAHSSEACYCLGILSRKPLPKVWKIQLTSKTFVQNEGVEEM